MSATAASEDLEALFDQVAAEAAARQSVVEEIPPPGTVGLQPAEPAGLFQRVGQLTRTLHDALRELGYDKSLQCAAKGLPDARDRLNYIATLTGQAAERALGAVERGQALQQELGGAATRLAKSWDELHEGRLSLDEFKALAAETRGFLAGLPGRAAETGAQFHEVMMAQDFHDLTGQVINRIVTLATSLESQLVKLLIDARPCADGAEAAAPEWLSGPAMNAAGRSDVVANQAQVDDLLESLGF